VLAITFAGGAFFVVHCAFELDAPTFIMKSFDGINWTDYEAFPKVTGSRGRFGGAVAAIRHPITGAPVYVSVGQIEQDDDNYTSVTHNLLWSSSDNGTDWSDPAFTPGMLEPPGTWYNLLENYTCTVAGGNIKGTPVFIAAAGVKTQVTNPRTGRFYAPLTAAAARSTAELSWNTTTLPGALPGDLDQLSFGLAVVFVKTSLINGYFLMTDHNFVTGDPANWGERTSTLYKSTDGIGWTRLRTNLNWMATLSTVAKNLNPRTIVEL
jgi:hypothetical protein